MALATVSHAKHPGYRDANRSSFVVDSKLPVITVTDESADSMYLHEIYQGQARVYVFSIDGCEPCSTHEQRWREKIRPLMLDEMPVIKIEQWPSRNSLRNVPNSFSEKGTTVYLDYEALTVEVSIPMVPATVCVDPNNKVRAVQMGSSPLYTAELVEFVTGSLSKANDD